MLTTAAKAMGEELQVAAEMVVDTLRAGNTIYIFGNGGSAADSQHFAAELVGRFKLERPGYPAVALTTDTSALTSIANDYSFEQIFARQLQGLSRKGDLAIGMTTSGNSANVVAALDYARDNGVATMAITGHGGGKCKDIADVLLAIPTSDTPEIQTATQVIYHVLCEIAELELTNTADVE
ncbi:MAG: SIS domain-containing protein [Phycisphaerales bacterium]|nr:SIS domain-containing protein [Phycisphaerales bacterium]MBT7012592.1 SIS domain-containing protein [Planctomycetota bacterium]